MRTDRALCVLLGAAVAGGCASAATPRSVLPADAARFIERRALCDHFLGEEPYDAERRAFLVRNVQTHCRGTDRDLARLRSAYRGNATVQAALATLEYPLGY